LIREEARKKRGEEDEEASIHGREGKKKWCGIGVWMEVG